MKFVKLSDRFAVQCLENPNTMLHPPVVNAIGGKLLLDELVDGFLFALGQALDVRA